MSPSRPTAGKPLQKFVRMRLTFGCRASRLSRTVRTVGWRAETRIDSMKSHHGTALCGPGRCARLHHLTAQGTTFRPAT